MAVGNWLSVKMGSVRCWWVKREFRQYSQMWELVPKGSGKAHSLSVKDLLTPRLTLLPGRCFKGIHTFWRRCLSQCGSGLIVHGWKDWVSWKAEHALYVSGQKQQSRWTHTNRDRAFGGSALGKKDKGSIRYTAQWKMCDHRCVNTRLQCALEENAHTQNDTDTQPH